MLRVSLRNLLARKLRLVMSAFAIVLGVAFVSGTLIFNDALKGAFDDIIEGSTADVEVGYPGANDFDSLQDNRTISASVVDDIARVPGVRKAYGNLQEQAVFVIGANGKVVGGLGPPGLAFNHPGTVNMAGDPVLTINSGRWPSGPGEVVLDAGTAKKAGYDVGDKVKLIVPTAPPTLTATLVGTADFVGGGTNGATLTIFDEQWMQDLFYDGKDVYYSISVAAEPGVSQTQLRDAVAKVLPAGLEARTGQSVADLNKQKLNDTFLKYLKTFMLVFAGISLIVGAFIIINTFSILVAGRARELALLRALGASRAQVTLGVLIEAFAVGVLGSTVGLLLGIALAQALRAMFSLIGLDLSQASFPVKPTTVLWCYLLGIAVTVVASYLPARRASKLPPIAALRDDVALPETTLRRRLGVGVALMVVGVASVVVGFLGSGNTGLELIGLGLFLVLIGVALVSPLLARPVIRAFGVLYRRVTPRVGQLATANSLRNPRRTAATASALMIGISLVTMVSILGASISKSTESSVAKSLRAQLIVSNAVAAPFSTDVAAQIAKLDGVREVSAVQQVYPVKIDGHAHLVAGVDPATIGQAVDLQVLDGSLKDLSPGAIAVNDDSARSGKLSVGDSVTAGFQAGDSTLHVVAIFKSDPAVPGGYLVDRATLQRGGLAPVDSTVFVMQDAGADTARVRDSIDEVLKDLPTVTVKDRTGYADEQNSQVTLFLNVIYGLLGLSVVIAVLGVVNTLGLSVIERTREIGLLRAIGLSRRQLRTMIRLESVVIAVFGALLGVIVGAAFGISLVKALKDQNVPLLAVPGGLLVVFVILSAAVGVLAAVVPGRRAARLDVLKAIATE